MKLVSILLLTLWSSFAFAEDIQVISTKDSNQQVPQEVSKPTVIIDIFGNTAWKYPANYFDPPKTPEKPKPVIPKQQVSKKEVSLAKEQIKAYKPFVKGSNTLHSLYAYGSVVGALHGVSGGYSFSMNYFSHGIEYRQYTNQNYDSDEEKTYTMINYKLEYHAFPMWYVNNKSFSTFDAGFSVSFGKVDILNADESTEAGIFWGFGGFLKYPLSQHIKVKGNIEILNGIGTESNANFGAASSIGLTLDF